MHGGKRSGAGRPKKPPKVRTPNNIERVLRKTTATEILAAVDEISSWNQLIQCKDPRVRLETLKYLTNRRDGMPAQSVDMKHSGAIVLRHSVPRPDRAENAS